MPTLDKQTVAHYKMKCYKAIKRLVTQPSASTEINVRIFEQSKQVTEEYLWYDYMYVNSKTALSSQMDVHLIVFFLKDIISMLFGFML